MQQNLMEDNNLNIRYLVGGKEQLAQAFALAPKKAFDEEIIELLDKVSHKLLENKEARRLPDVITFAFWIRKTSLLQMKTRFDKDDIFRIGRGMIFHIAPSNVAVNFAYSLVAGLLCGNANVVKAPSKDFEQVNMITKAFQEVLSVNESLKPYVNVVQYGHEKEINDMLSEVCNVRVIWGGNQTIQQIRQSPMGARATEVAFADRFSVAYIDAEHYLSIPDKVRIANDFYNDTYLTDQNACTSPRIIFWQGEEATIQEAKNLFWENLHECVQKKYVFQDICAVDKLCNLYQLAAGRTDIDGIPTSDNLIVRVKVKAPVAELLKWKCHAGFFFEYDCKNVLQLKDVCNDMACQTISYLGKKEMLLELLAAGIKGVDRVVPMGKTMDFDLIWDGYNLVERFTRIIDVK